jgi:DNA topoisomerase-1
MASSSLTTTALPESVQSAKEAGLRYIVDDRPGIQRRRAGKGFRYIGADGKTIRDRETLARIRSLVIPPAWKDVWISPVANGHLQATGRDAKGRKQSRYHPNWRAVRDETKYEHLLEFGQALPQIRKRIDEDLSLPGLPRQKILATLARLLESTLIRVGNTEYAKSNKSYGLTTMRNKHTHVEGSKVTFSFQGKSGVRHAIKLTDHRVANIIKRCQNLPGQELFQYLDEEGATHTIDSQDVNEYLREISGRDITAKDFRTWAGTVMACILLRQAEAFTSEAQAKRNVVRAIQEVARRLGNTPAVCRKCYVHPAVLDRYMSGSMARALRGAVSKTPAPTSEEQMANASVMLREGERVLLRVLRPAVKRASAINRKRAA